MHDDQETDLTARQIAQQVLHPAVSVSPRKNERKDACAVDQDEQNEGGQNESIDFD